ncbi:Y-family DNA polymerase [Candidatus Phycosocius spiralis]|uniref:DNA-directed DNA polymerase n=1 Tax=Candidatus Phycosocius spiralis TaxID=2815099 RepID=A0ABQ4PSG3_9PROT|nr:Y-family DNA polymerase [Candidatus Phycosocius spiralis]GIU65941.1 umuC protein [Candidatus Phycosocius spiralis]
MAIFALVDCNNFYASCERLFQPHLRGRPVVILSNNDGCVIARSDEAKSLGILMGTPAFKIRQLIKAHDIAVCSSNYALYGDISERVMRVLGESAPNQEIYSIDECFLDLDRLSVPNLTQWCRNLRHQTMQWTGIPVSIGIGPTKTLAKLANRLAKKSVRESGVLNFMDDPIRIDTALRETSIGDVWGIGRRWTQKLEERGIHTAHDFANAPDAWVRQCMGVVGLRTVHELRGIACHALADQPAPKQTTCYTRTFGTAIYDKMQIQDAVTCFTEQAAAKLRKTGQVAGAVQLFIQTDPFARNVPKKSVSGLTTLDRPTSNTRAIATAVTQIFDRIWQDGYGWRKAGVHLFDLSAPDQIAPSLLDVIETPNDSLMKAVDHINTRYGRGAARMGFASKNAAWQMQQAHVSPRFTTKWAEIPAVRMM